MPRMTHRTPALGTILRNMCQALDPPRLHILCDFEHLIQLNTRSYLVT